MVKVKQEKKGEKRKAEEAPTGVTEPDKKQKSTPVSETRINLVLKWKTKLFAFLKGLPSVQQDPELIAQLNEMEGRVKLDLLMALRRTFITPFAGDYARSCEAMMKQWSIKPALVDQGSKDKMALYLQWLEDWFREIESDGDGQFKL